MGLSNSVSTRHCYKSIIDSLETLLKHPGLEEQCEKWKSRKIDDDLYADVYDGQIWKQFGYWKGNKPFLDLARSFGTHDSPSATVKIQASILCFASDIPAARKLCGFLGHSARRGCSHCYKEFPGGFGEQRNYGGFQDRDQWPKRSSQQHRRDAYRVKNCTSESASEKLASQLGVRYTVLLELPYYTSIEMCVIDPMHNLFLGTAKKVFSKWI